MLSILICPQTFQADLLEMGRIELVSLESIQVSLSTRILKRVSLYKSAYKSVQSIQPTGFDGTSHDAPT